MLHETQVAADTGSFNAILGGGSVTYVHGGTIDQPLEVYTASTNLILPYTNWHGQFVRGTCVGGGCAGVQYPLSDASAYDDIPGGVAQGTWFGTLIKGQLDASGYEYKRNRYYNPSTGRFNQEDPIGLAGGLNVYGYASGDPASYSDPFGLCTPKWICAALDNMSAGYHSYLQRVGLEESGESIASSSSRAFALGELTAELTLGLGGAGLNLPEVGAGAAATGTAEISATTNLGELLLPGGSPIGQAGSSAGIREVTGGVTEANELFGRLSQGGSPVTNSNYPGTLVQLPNGGSVGMRTAMSRSPGTAATIDVNVEGISITKIKFNPTNP